MGVVTVDGFTLPLLSPSLSLSSFSINYFAVKSETQRITPLLSSPASEPYKVVYWVCVSPKSRQAAPNPIFAPMRIRQRQPLFPLPSISSLPLSDPHLLPPTPVVVQLHHPPHPPPSDHPLPPIATPPHDSSAQDALHAHSNKRYGSVSEA